MFRSTHTGTERLLLSALVAVTLVHGSPPWPSGNRTDVKFNIKKAPYRHAELFGVDLPGAVAAGTSGNRTVEADPPGPYFETWPVVAEAENFTLTPATESNPAFSVTNWGQDHFYGATFSNTFASRKALLHSTKDAVGTATSGSVAVPRAGTWYVCVRYEAAFRFETEFKLTVKQGGAAKLTQYYGQRASKKIWPFGWSLLNHEIGGCELDPTAECHWTWGATENWVWEYYPVTLAASDVTFELDVSNVTSEPRTMGMLTDRNVDAVMLTQNLTNIQNRMLFEQQLALDGMLSQQNEVFARVTNTGPDDMTLQFPMMAYHAACPGQHMICIPYCTSRTSSDGVVHWYDGQNQPVGIPVLKGGSSDWVEVGSRLDVFNDGTWQLMAVKPPPPPAPKYSCSMGPAHNQCGVDPAGTYTTAACSDKCKPVAPPPPPPKYSCNMGAAHNQCGPDPAGNYTSSACSDKCKPVPMPPFAPEYTVEFGVKKGGGAVKSIGTFKSQGCGPRYAGGQACMLELAVDANTVATERIRVVDAALPEAIAEAKAGAVPPGSKGSVTTFPVFGYTFCASGPIRTGEPGCYHNLSVSSAYIQNVEAFNELIPMSTTAACPVDGSNPRPQCAMGVSRGQMYTDFRSIYKNLTTLEIALKEYVTAGTADKVMVVSMGDEITLDEPWEPDVYFPQFCKAEGYPAADCAHYNFTDASKPGQFWYSNLYRNAFGLQRLGRATTLITQYLKNAGVGANYSPLTYQPAGYVSPAYFYPVNKAVTMFRQGAMTMPWGEDYSWQSPLGTQQMTTILHDVFRAGIRNAKTPQESQMMFYTMAHAPGTTAIMWRRNYYNYLAHGMTRLNLYEMRPATASYTENYVDVGYGVYGAVRTALSETAEFEDIMEPGTTVASGDVGLWCSDAGDIWVAQIPPALYGKHQSTLSASKKALYIALLHLEVPLDIVVEDDIGPTLNTYTTLYLADAHVTQKASVALAAWVAQGGHLVGTAGAGMYDELNNTNLVLQKLFGVLPVAKRETSSIQYIKQDLRFAEVLGNVSWTGPGGTVVNTSVCAVAPTNATETMECGNRTYGCDRSCAEASFVCHRNVTTGAETPTCGCSGCNYTDHAGPYTFPSVGFRSLFTVNSVFKADVLATYQDVVAGKNVTTPAVTVQASGTGLAYYMGFLPGYAYFMPAIPMRPADRGGTDDAFTHFIPTNFSKPTLELLRSTLHANTTKQVNCSNHFVHGRVVTSTKGVVVPLSNWNTYTSPGQAPGPSNPNATAPPNFNNITNFNVTVTHTAVKPGMKVSLATGGSVTEVTGSNVAGGVTYMLGHFAIADALIIRPK